MSGLLAGTKSSVVAAQSAFARPIARAATTRIKDRLGLHELPRPNEGVLVIDRTGHSLHANPMATEMVTQHDGVGLVNGRLYFSDNIAARRYGGILRELAPSGFYEDEMATHNFPARRPNGNRPYLIAIHILSQEEVYASLTLSAVIVIFIRDPARFIQLDAPLLRQSYGLSAAETELAIMLDRGLTLRDAAKERGVSITTVRSQLYALMAKLDVNRQSDLIRLLTNYRQSFA